jgi:hypothetical protein
LGEGLLDHLRVLADLRAFPKRELKGYEQDLCGDEWFSTMLQFPEDLLRHVESENKSDDADIEWFQQQAKARVRELRQIAEAYLPW